MHNKLWHSFGNYSTLFLLPTTFIPEKLPKIGKDFRWCSTFYCPLFVSTWEPFPGNVSVKYRQTYIHFNSQGTSPSFPFPTGFQRTGKERRGQDQSDSPRSHTSASTSWARATGVMCDWAHVRGEEGQVLTVVSTEENDQSQTQGHGCRDSLLPREGSPIPGLAVEPATTSLTNCESVWVWVNFLAFSVCLSLWQR